MRFRDAAFTTVRAGGAGRRARALGWSLVLAGAALALPVAASAQRMAGWDAAVRGNVTRAVAVPNWMNGRITAEQRTVGRVRRESLGESEALSLFDVTLGGSARYGRFSYDYDDPQTELRLRGDCIYDQTERRAGYKGVEAHVPLRPLLVRCRFTRDGAAVGIMTLRAAPRLGALVQVERRVGEVDFEGTVLGIESVHKLAKSGIPTELPAGYRFLAGAETVGAVDLTRMSRRDIAVPADRARQRAAMAAALSLALFWDPGDPDD